MRLGIASSALALLSADFGLCSEQKQKELESIGENKYNIEENQSHDDRGMLIDGERQATGKDAELIKVERTRSAISDVGILEDDIRSLRLTHNKKKTYEGRRIPSARGKRSSLSGKKGTPQSRTRIGKRGNGKGNEAMDTGKGQGRQHRRHRGKGRSKGTEDTDTGKGQRRRRGKGNGETDTGKGQGERRRRRGKGARRPRPIMPPTISPTISPTESPTTTFSPSPTLYPTYIESNQPTSVLLGTCEFTGEYRCDAERDENGTIVSYYYAFWYNEESYGFCYCGLACANDGTGYADICCAAICLRTECDGVVDECNYFTEQDF